MKLLYAIKSLDHAHGGAERVLADVTDDLFRKGHDISILTFDRPGGESFYNIHPSIKRISLGIGHPEKRSTFLETFKRILAVRKAIKQDKPDAVVAFMHSMFIPTALALVGTGVPVIASEHIVPEHYKSRKLEFALFLVSSLFVKKFTVISEQVRDLYPAYLRKRMEVMPNPVFNAEHQNREQDQDSKHQELLRKVILNVGRLDPQKDQKTLIRAFAQIAPYFPEWDLRIVGEGELREELETLIRQYGLEERIFLPGLTKNIASEYEAADIFAISSKYESFGLATAEALSHGLPALGFADCPGTNEVIQSGYNGLLVNSHDRAGVFAKGLQHLIQNPALRARYGMNGVKSVEQYSSDRVARNWEALLSQIKADAPSRINRYVYRHRKPSYRAATVANQNFTSTTIPANSQDAASSAVPIDK